MSGRASPDRSGHAVPFCNSRGGAHDLLAEASAQAGMTRTTDGFPAVVSCFPEFSCQNVFDQRINDVSVKALLVARGDFLPLARVGSWFLACSIRAFVSCKKHALVNEAKAAGLTRADFPQITVGVNDHGRQRQTKV